MIDPLGLSRDESTQVVLSGGGGSARDVEPDRCCLAGTDFLGAMVVDFGYRSAKTTNLMKAGDEKAAKNWVEGKMNSRQVFIGLQNMRRFVAVKNPTLRLSLTT